MLHEFMAQHQHEYIPVGGFSRAQNPATSGEDTRCVWYVIESAAILQDRCR